MPSHLLLSHALHTHTLHVLHALHITALLTNTMSA